MVAVQGLFETHITATDLARSIQFYRDVIGLRLAHVASTRGAVFFWVGPGQNAMLGVWSAGSGPQRMLLHTAFRVSLADVIAAPQQLTAAGVTPLDFDGQATDEPVVLAWMPAASVFFHDPDGHLLEYVAMLPDAPQPERGVVRWTAWTHTHRAVTSEGRPCGSHPGHQIEQAASVAQVGRIESLVKPRVYREDNITRQQV